MSRVAAIQMTSGITVEKNLQTAAKLIAQAAATGAKLVVLPEMFAELGKTYADKLKIQEPIDKGPIQDFLASQAKQHKIWLVGGTIPIASDNPNKVYAACLVYNANGERVARYDKIHLFDASVTKGIEEHQESIATEPGKQVVVLDTPVGKLGLAVCYDIRFPELFRQLALKQAEIIAIPAAFTAKTGQAHWELLTRARAVENFCYVIGACQSGTHENGRQTFGDSLIINPWGEVLVSLPTEPGVVSAEIDLDKLHEIRRDFPVDKHHRLDSGSRGQATG